MERLRHSPVGRRVLAAFIAAGFWLTASSSLFGQSILTIAGGGPLGDGKSAVSANLKQPADVAVDSDGNLLIADSSNHRLRRVDALTSTISTVAGGGTSGPGDGGPATLAELLLPTAIVIDDDGNIYVAEIEGHRVRRIDRADGTISLVAGSIDGLSGFEGDGGPASEALLTAPVDLALDVDGNLLIADSGNGRIRKVDRISSTISTVAGNGATSDSGDGGPATLAGFEPSGIAVDLEGNLVITTYDNRIRRVDGFTGIISTIAGNGNALNTGNGGPAVDAEVFQPLGPAFDSSGNLLFSVHPAQVRRIDAETGTIDLVAGLIIDESEFRGFSGDGGPALEARLNLPSRLTLDDADQLLIADSLNHRVRRVDSAGEIATVAGGGPVGDSGPAIAAQLSQPLGITLGDEGTLIIADQANSRIRKVDLSTGEISTIAGTGVAGEYEEESEDQPALDVVVPSPAGIAFDGEGNLFVADTNLNRVRRIDAMNGTIRTIAGNGNDGTGGDGGPAIAAPIGRPIDIAFDSSGNLFIIDNRSHRIRRVDTSGVITTIAGSGDAGSPGSYSGDGGPATMATMNEPRSIAFDTNDNLYVADSANHRIRVINATTQIITTFAGNGTGIDGGDGGPATLAGIGFPYGNAFDDEGHLFVVSHGSRVRRIDAASGQITAVAGNGLQGFAGDNGPALDASMNTPQRIAVDDNGSIFISDSINNRIRAVFGCIETGAPSLVSPSHGAVDVSTAPNLVWERPAGAFRFDVVLIKEGDVPRTVASDLTTTTFTPQNLDHGTVYRWRVIARGDPFCDPVSENMSETRAFTTVPPCEAPSTPNLASPGEGATVEEDSAVLSWNAVARASTYDVYLGTTLPPPLFRSTSSTTFITPRLVTGNTYYWFIVAHASCDASLTTPSETRSFFLAGPCLAAGEFELTKPADHEIDVPTTTTLSWAESDNATSYDLYLGTTNPPSIFLAGMRDSLIRITGLDPQRTYFWQVRANVSCDANGGRISDVHQFSTVNTCLPPQATSIVFTPPGDVSLGQSYGISWNPAAALDAGGTYVVERSLDPSFATVLDTQELTDTTATFVAGGTGLYYHRVRPVTRCNPSQTGAYSSSVTVRIVDEESNVVFTVEPRSVVGEPGRNLEDLETRFTVENISNKRVQAVIGRTEIASVPFFQIVDPLGGDSAFVTLEPRQPRTFAIRFSGPRNDLQASYQGLVFLSLAGSSVVPYAFVNLKVGDQGTVAPGFRSSGTTTEYAFFPGLDGDDADRPPITVEIHNPGTTPMELGAEIGPELWLEPEPGWNDSPIPAGATRSIELSTRRKRALNGSALPRYTYFTVRTKTGESARLLVQDNPALPASQARTFALEPDAKSLVIPEAVSENLENGGSVVSRVHFSNLGSEAVQAELIFTPTSSDGFSAAVLRAIVIVPPNDVATLTDPLVQIFGLSRPAMGQLEIRAAESKLGLLSIESSIISSLEDEASLARIPTVRRNDGARLGSPHQIAGISATEDESTHLILAETSGTDSATVALTLYDSTGSMLGSDTVTLERYGHVRIDDLVTSLGGTRPLSAGRITISVTDQGGSVVGLARIEDSERERASILLSSPPGDGVAAKRIRWSNAKRGPSDGVTTTLVAPYVVTGTVDSTGVDWSTVMGFQAPFGTQLDFTVTFTDSSGQTFTKPVSVLGGAIVEFDNVLEQLFGITVPTEGSIVIEADPRGLAYSRLIADGIPAGTFDLVSSVSELVTMASNARPLFIDGVEQSTDTSRGTRWNLYLREIAGQSGVVTLRLYEAGNRTHPIAIKDFNVTANSQLSFETIFDAMDLNTDSRRKDRTNVLAMLTPKSGNAQITGVALEIDNRTGSATPHTLQPASGLPASGVSTSLVRVISTGSSQRRRPVKRGD